MQRFRKDRHERRVDMIEVPVRVLLAVPKIALGLFLVLAAIGTYLGFATKDTTKSGKARFIPMDPALAKRIKAMAPGRVFSDIPSSTRRKAWRAACKAAGLDWYPAPRDLRRTFATLARAGGADLEAVRVALGHAHLSTTDIYLGERPEARDDALLAVQPVLGVA
jgi:integrase